METSSQAGFIWDGLKEIPGGTALVAQVVDKKTKEGLVTTKDGKVVVKFQGVDDGMTEFKNPATNKVIMFLVHKTNANFLSGTPASWWIYGAKPALEGQETEKTNKGHSMYKWATATQKPGKAVEVLDAREGIICRINLDTSTSASVFMGTGCASMVGVVDDLSEPDAKAGRVKGTVVAAKGVDLLIALGIAHEARRVASMAR